MLELVEITSLEPRLLNNGSPAIFYYINILYFMCDIILLTKYYSSRLYRRMLKNNYL